MATLMRKSTEAEDALITSAELYVLISLYEIIVVSNQRLSLRYKILSIHANIKHLETAESGLIAFIGEMARTLR